MATIPAFHGTSSESAEKIVSSRTFKPSDSDRDWAGTGIYFFVPPNEVDINEASSNAYKWARYIKKFPEDEISVISALLESPDDKIFDLTESRDQFMFHKYREILFNDAVRRFKKNGKKGEILIKSDRNRKCFDCYTINTICEKNDFKLVIRDAFINFSLNKYSYRYYSSDIPNVRIACARDNGVVGNLEVVRNE